MELRGTLINPEAASQCAILRTALKAVPFQDMA